MISVDEARAIICKALSPLETEDCAIDAAAGRTLAEPLRARLTQPPFAASAMDGYAVRLADTVKEGATLNVIGVSSAGERYDGAVTAGSAVRIYTGAPVPDGADHVIIQENVERAEGIIRVLHAQTQARNIRPAGIDFRKGEKLIAAGARLTGPRLALAAAGNHARLAVRRRPRVAIIANGDELVPPGSEPNADEIISSISYGLAPMIEGWGGAPDFLGVAPDDPAAIAEIVEQALSHDLIVPIGGASVGDRDYMRRVFAEFGFTSLFEKVSVKPGKPAWFGAVRKAHVIGLPGNPASALVTAMLFVKPAIGRLLGAVEGQDRCSARLTASLTATGPRETYVRARLAHSDDGALLATLHGDQDSSLMRVFADSDLLIRRMAHAPAADIGDVVECVKISG